MMIHADSLKKCSLNKKRKTSTNSTNIFHENLTNFKTLTENYFRDIENGTLGGCLIFLQTFLICISLESIKSLPFTKRDFFPFL